MSVCCLTHTLPHTLPHTHTLTHSPTDTHTLCANVQDREGVVVFVCLTAPDKEGAMMAKLLEHFLGINARDCWMEPPSWHGRLGKRSEAGKQESLCVWNNKQKTALMWCAQFILWCSHRCFRLGARPTLLRKLDKLFTQTNTTWSSFFLFLFFSLSLFARSPFISSLSPNSLSFPFFFSFCCSPLCFLCCL